MIFSRVTATWAASRAKSARKRKAREDLREILRRIQVVADMGDNTLKLHDKLSESLVDELWSRGFVVVQGNTVIWGE